MAINAYDFDPYDHFKNVLKPESEERAKRLIEDLTKKGEVDIEGNKKLSKEIAVLNQEITALSKKNNSHKGLKSFLFVLSCIGAIAIVISILCIVGETYEPLIPGIVIGVSAAVIIFYILYTKLVLNKKIKTLEDKLAKLNSERDAKINEAWGMLDKLRQALNFKQFVDFVNGLDTEIKLDYEVDPKKLYFLRKKFKLGFGFEICESILDVFSGSICNNPFIRVLVRKRDERDYRYEGSRTVTWTETVRDSKGNTRTVTRSETLYAYHTEMAPFYDTYSMVIYGNGAAPNLIFSRTPSGLKLDHDEKDVQKLVKKRYKDIEDYAEKAVTKGKNFTALANQEFEGLFYAIDRNHEAQFRLLFTPLAQQNMCELITANDTYGDDFSFYKQKQINVITSYHSQNSITFDYQRYYQYYNFEELEKDYVYAICEAFNSLYFDLAPLLAIPLYQMEEAPFMDGILDKEEITIEEAEAFANAMDDSLFKHEETATLQILKVERNKNYTNTDYLTVTSHSYNKIPHVITKPVLCSNGRVYNVDVHYYIYNPLVTVNNMGVSKIKEDTNKDMSISKEYKGYRYHNFVSCFLGLDSFSKDDDKLFANYIKKYYNSI